MYRCSITFSSTGRRSKICSGTHQPCGGPSDKTPHSRNKKPKNHMRRSRQNTATPAARTTRKLHPR